MSYIIFGQSTKLFRCTMVYARYADIRCCRTKIILHVTKYWHLSMAFSKLRLIETTKKLFVFFSFFLPYKNDS